VSFLGVWWCWHRFGPPTGESAAAVRDNVALGVAAVVTSAVVAGMGWWAGRNKPTVTEPQTSPEQNRPGQAEIAETVDAEPESAPSFQAQSSSNTASTENTSVAEDRSAAVRVVGNVPRAPVGFQPRTALLQQLETALEAGQPTGEHFVTDGPRVRTHRPSRRLNGRVCSITGRPGVGKTQLAASLARKRIEAGWDLVAWLAAESVSHVITGLSEIADTVDARVPTLANTRERAQAAKRWLENTTERVLVVFDDVTNPDDVAPWLPATGTAQIVLTSRSPRCDTLGTRVQVGPFTEEETLAYLQERTGLNDDAGARAVGEAVEQLPLALPYAATVIRSQHLPYLTYVDQLKRFPLDERLSRVDGREYPQGAGEAIALAVEEVEATHGLDGLTGRLLDVLAMLSPAGVNRDFLALLPVHTDPSGEARPESATAAVGSERVDAALGTLADASLVVFSHHGQSVIMHRLVAQVLRDRARRRSRLTTVLSDAVEILNRLLVPHDKAREQRQIAAEVINHIDALTDTLDRDPSTGRFTGDSKLIERVTELRIWVGQHLKAAGNLAHAIGYEEALLTDAERSLGPDHPQTLTIRNNLAVSQQEIGEIEVAIDLYHQVLATEERVLGPDHPDTLTTRGNLATAYQAVGQFPKAIDLFHQILTSTERSLGPDHPYALAARYNLATIYQQAGRFDEAIEFYRQVLATEERTLGPDHPDPLITRQNLATAYQQAGRLDDAIPLYQQALTGVERTLGPDHPHTLATQHSLAGAYRAAGRLDEAIELLQQARAGRERILGPDHPHTLATRHNLASAYEAAGRLEEAIDLFRHVLTSAERVFGPNHPSTLTARGNLAAAYQVAGQFDEAITLYQQTLTGAERTLGPDHPDTMTTRGNLAVAYRSAGRLAEAITLYQKVIADRERALGPNHRDTRAARYSLANAYQSAGRLDEAITLYQQILTEDERTLGPEHPDTLSTRHSLASAHQAAGHLDQAISLYQQALTSAERVLGPDHSDTLVIRHGLATAYRAAGRLDEAITLYQQAITSAERTLGPDHPDTLTIRGNLAVAYRSAGRFNEAIDLYQQAITSAERTLGPDHPDTLAIQHSLAGAYWLAGRRDEAVSLYQQVLTARERTLGPDHPDTMTTRRALETLK